MTKTKISMISALIVLSCLFPVFAFSAASPKAVSGVLDLSEWDFLKNGVTPLDGKWEFYWKQMLPPSAFSQNIRIPHDNIPVPESWTNSGFSPDGYATYRLTLKCPYRGILGLRILDMATSYNLWINGTAIAKNGIVSDNKDLARPEYRPRVVFFSHDGGPLEITVQVSNYHHRKGGIWESIIIGTPAAIHELREKSVNIEMFIIGALLIMTFYHLGLFLFRKQDRYTLYFGLLCLTMAIRTGFIGNRLLSGMIPWLTWETAGRIEFLSAYLCVPVFLMFICSLFSSDTNSQQIIQSKRILITFGGALCLAVAVLPVKIGSYSLNVFAVYFTIVTVFVIFIISKAVRRKRDGSWLMLIGFLALAGTAANDILYNNLIINTGNYAPAGLFIFVLSQANIISLRFSRAFEKVEVLTTQLKSNNTQLKNLNTQLEQKNREITQRLFIDRLTGLPNRQSLFIDVGSITNPILLLIDIDSFKEINDFYGNKIGDFVLKEAAAMIKTLLTSNSQSLYKLSVDEYAILINEEMDERTASQFAHYICREAGKNPIIHGSNEIYIRITIGVALGSIIKGQKSFEEIIVRADMALKRAKRFGKPYLIYDESMQIIKEYEKNMLWARKIKNALESGRIVPFYQPIANNATGVIEKFECLVRLIDEDGGIISPFHFLDVARKSRLYPELTKAMVCKSFAFFKNTRYEFSINISIDDILDEDTRMFIFDTMSENPKTCHRVVFELLESQGIENYSEVTDFITVVKSMGAKIAVDDFGSGYSNFEHIMKLNIDFIKIDASLIKNIHFDKNSQAIVKTISVFARELGLKTVAEFVHCKEVHDKGIEFGLDFSQGYYLGEPKAHIDHLVKPPSPFPESI